MSLESSYNKFAFSILELAISPTLNVSLMPRNPNDAPSNAGQSSSQLNAGGGNGTETSSNQQSQSSLNQTEITMPSEPTTVKADASQQVQASSMG